MQSVINSMPVVIALALIAFTIASHTLAFTAQVFKDLNKDKPGWIDTASTWIGKGLDFLNGLKKA